MKDVVLNVVLYLVEFSKLFYTLSITQIVYSNIFKRLKTTMKQSFHDIAFIQELKRRFDTDVITEYKFCPKRRWKCDFYLPQFSLIIEKEGGIWTHGRHTRSVGFLNDIEKYNELTVRGYWLIRVTPQTINKTETFDLIQRHINRNIEIPF